MIFHQLSGPSHQPGGLESLGNASMALVGHEAFHVATEVHFAVDLGLLVLHVAHLQPDPIKSPPEMMGFILNQEMILWYRKVAPFMCPFVSVMSYSCKKMVTLSHAHDVLSNTYLFHPWPFRNRPRGQHPSEWQP